MAQEQFKCTGVCLNCLPAQRAYCASQHAYSNMKVLDRMMEVVAVMQGDLKIISQKIEALQNNEATIFDPNEEKTGIPTIPKAQEGAGAIEQTPQNNSPKS